MVEKPTYEILEKRIQELEQEVVDHKHAEESLKEVETNLKKSQRIAHIGNWRWDIGADKIVWSDELFRIVGLSPQNFDANYKAYLSCIHPDDLEFFKKETDTALKEKTPYSIEYRIVRPNNDTRFVYETGEVTVDENDNPIELIGTVQDITENTHAENKLKESESKFKFLAENMGDIVWTLDMDLNATYVSPSVEKILGYTVEERKKQKMEDMVTPKTFERVMAMFVKELEREKLPGVDLDRSVNTEVEYFHKNGSIVWMENTVKAIRDEFNAIVGMYGVSHDITERKLFMNKLKGINNTLEQKVKKRTTDLEDMNAALRVLLKKRKEDKIEMEERLFANFKLVISPFIKKLKSTLEHKIQNDIIDILESELKDIISPFSKKLSNPMVGLTPTEIEIAGLIKFGKSNKEIAGIQNSAIRTIAYHRENIRKKLDLKNKKINLKSYLLTLQ